MYEETLDRVSISKGKQIRFNCKFTEKKMIGYFMLPLLTLKSKVTHTLFDKYLDHKLVKFKKSRMVRTTHNFDFFLTKMVNHF